MKKIFYHSFIFGVLFVVLFGFSCKKTAETFGITVTLYEGVSGTPAAGTYTYNKGDKVTYDYSLNEGFEGLKVYLDDAEIDPSGEFTVSGNHELIAYPAGTGEYKLSVTLQKGVKGTPLPGTYYFDLGETLDYDYTLEEGYGKLQITIDTVVVANSGTITFSADHTLYGYADKQYSIPGGWRLFESYDDDSFFNVKLTFTGDDYSGTVTDSDGGTGTYEVDGNDVHFTLDFPDVKYEYWGIFDDEDNLEGICRRSQSADVFFNGTWTAAREDTLTQNTATGKAKGKGLIKKP